MNNKMLVVDSDKNIREMLKIYFTGQGYEVMTAEDGKGAIVLLSPETMLDIIIIEEALPDMEGRDLPQALWQKVYMNPRPAVIYLATKSERSDRIGSFISTTDDVITKPFDIEELKTRVQWALKK